MLTYAIVVATKNRADALAKSIPLFLSQTRPAARLVVVDASDDHAKVRDVVRQAAGGASHVEVLRAPRPGSAAQRNAGLERVRESVVMFPDDDSLWFPDTAAEMMALYERDTGGLVGGVTGLEVAQSPLGSPPSTSGRRRGKSAILRLRNIVEDRFVPQPFHLYARDRIAALRPAYDAAGLTDPLVETLGGFRMSFRTEVARRLRFDEALGVYVGYSQHEDKDLSLRVLASGQLLAAAHKARVYHDVYPGARTKGGFEYGFCQILNYAYICKKTVPADSPAFAAIRRYSRYKGFLYGLRRKTPYLRDVARGALAAIAELDVVLAAPPEHATEVYLAATARALGRD